MTTPTSINPLRVDVWSDFVCPYCLIGSLRLDALAKTQPIDVAWHAFMLRPPGAPPMTAEKRAMIAEHTPKLAAQIRDEFGIDIARGPLGTQTFAAHHATKQAEREGRGREFHDAVLRAYWLRAEDISDAAVLRELGEPFGLSFDDDVLAGREPDTALAVSTDIEQAQAFNIRGVPAFVFGNRYFVSGAQPLDVLAKAAAAACEAVPAVH
jgi:predicted DsbA family dithiol-disulfide isomerase